jgi:hypothetical protein
MRDRSMSVFVLGILGYTYRDSVDWFLESMIYSSVMASLY